MEPDAGSRFALHGRVAVVTGALGRLGPVWCQGLASAGARVVALDLGAAPPSEGFTSAVETWGERTIRLVRADVTDRASLEAALLRCREIFGEPTVLVNNAGIDQPPSSGATRHPLERIPPEVWESVLRVNLVGLFQTCQVFGGAMVEGGAGSIINIGSLYAGVSPDPRFYDHLGGHPPFLKPPAYGASKAGVVSLTRYLATHWAPRGVRVNALSPGGVLGGQDEQFKTKFVARIPLGRMATPDDLIGPLLFLASDASRYVTGIELMVDGGFTAW